MKKFILLFSGLILGIFPLLNQAMPLPTFAPNTKIDYDLINLGNNRYRYVYTITNDTSTNTTKIQLFDIQFDRNLYDENSLVITTTGALAADWTENILFSIANSEPVYNASSSIGIADGQNRSGFSVEFTWLGQGMPLEQDFEIYDVNTNAFLEFGKTKLGQFINNPPPQNIQTSAQSVPTLSNGTLAFLFFLILLVIYRKSLKLHLNLESK